MAQQSRKNNAGRRRTVAVLVFLLLLALALALRLVIGLGLVLGKTSIAFGRRLALQWVVRVRELSQG